PHAAGRRGDRRPLRRHPLRRLALAGGWPRAHLPRPAPPRRRCDRRGPDRDGGGGMSLRVEDLTVRYGEVTALDSLSVRIAAGEVTGLVGMNGAGKSTLFGAIMGTVPIASGQVLLDDEEPARARRRGAIGYVPQGEAIDSSFPVSVADVVMMGRYGHQGLT